MTTSLPEENYVRNGLVVGIRSGHLLVVNLDLGMFVWRNGVPLKVKNLYCEQIATPKGVAARKAASYAISRYETQIRVEIQKPSRGVDTVYGNVWFLDGDQWWNYADYMVENGYGLRSKPPVDTTSTAK